MSNLFVDLDGVLADFDKAALRVFGCAASVFEQAYGTERFWEVLQNADRFFYKLEPLPGAVEFWRSIERLNPTILTGVPQGNWSQSQKVRWCWDYLGRNTKVITTQARRKGEFCDEGDILIDDRYRNAKSWQKAGGVFIHHKNFQDSHTKLVEVLYQQSL